ncbi:MAG: hypothetical protein J2P13_05130 [Acidobacteria bacterium]|nr:hypothetical protein [Acidobacteriota bacterium]
MRFAHLGIVALAFASLQVAAQAGAAAKPSAAATKASCAISPRGELKCPRFGFAYKIPFGWVDRTADLGNEAQNGGGEDAKNPRAEGQAPDERPSSSAAETLLAVFERPPAAPGDTINSAVVIAAEPLVNYRQIKTAADYFAAINEVAAERGFKVANGPYAFPVGRKQLVRGDFSKQRGKLTMWQSSLVMIESGYIVSFTVIGASEDENDELISNLSFSSPAHSSHSVQR